MRYEKLAGVVDEIEKLSSLSTGWRKISHWENVHISTGCHIVERKMANNVKFIISVWTYSCCLAYCIKSSFVVFFFSFNIEASLLSSEILLMIFSAKKDLWFNQIYEAFREVSHRVLGAAKRITKTSLRKSLWPWAGEKLKMKAESPTSIKGSIIVG